MIGRTISHYRITEKLGEGGMGVVYKTEDTSLNRTVALKFLAAHLLKDEEANKRFRREARAAASLHHPNVCTIHEIGEAEGQTFLAMAFIEGESLDQRIERGPLKITEALDIAQQIAKGLEAAHKKKIVHRDIKPGNVVVDDGGHVTVMDFGLALLTEGSKLTQLDTTVGTVAYMSPEQAEGAAVDHRTDIWALGCVLYEMVCGRRAFKGQYDQALLYEIVNQEPEPLTGLRAGVPMELEWIAGKCLAKDAALRYQSAAEIVVDLETLREKLKSGRSTILRRQSGGETEVVVSAPQLAADAGRDDALTAYRVIEQLDSRGDSLVYRANDVHLKRPVTISVLPESAARSAEKRQRLQKWGIYAMAALLAVALAGIVSLWLAGRGPGEPPPLRRFAYAPTDYSDPGFYIRPVAISPDGKHIAAADGGSERLWIQDLDRQQPREIEGTEGAFSPFWSPGSDFIGFAAGNELKKVPVQGGPPVRLCELPSTYFNGGAWSPDGEVIVFGSGPPFVLYQVSARGGDPEVVISGESPDFLPGEAGRRMLVFTFGDPTTQTMMVQDLESGGREILGPGHQPVYSAGHLVYQLAPQTQDLWAVPFSLRTLTTTGEPFPVAQVARSPTAAADGTLVYFDGIGQSVERPTWFDRRGNRMGDVGRGQDFTVDPALSPDGRRVAVSARENANQDIWVHDLGTGVKTRITTDSDVDYRPIWSPDGERILFAGNASGNAPEISLRRADGSGETQTLLDTAPWVSDWSRDGESIVYVVIDPENEADLWYLQRDQGDEWEPHPFLQTQFRERTPSLSPDGRFIAYASNESGQDEIYVQPFPDGGRRTTVSNNGGWQPRWSRDGRELFYVEETRLIAVSVDTSAAFSVRERTPLFEHPSLGRSYYPQYDISADGQRFIIATPFADDPDAKPMIRIVQNWVEEFRHRLQD